MTSLAIGPVAPASAAARELLRAYFDDVASRYLGRAVTACEVDAAMRDDPSDDLVVLLVAWWGGAALGCGGLRLLGYGTGRSPGCSSARRPAAMGSGRRCCASLRQPRGDSV